CRRRSGSLRRPAPGAGRAGACEKPPDRAFSWRVFGPYHPSTNGAIGNARMRIAYFDTFSGISGDMTVGALLDLGLPLDAVRAAVRVLALRDVEVSSERVARSGIGATKFHVRVGGRHPDIPHPAHGHAHRPYVEIRSLLEGSRLAEPVKQTALAIFRRLAEAEGRVHGVPVDAVEFHEVGALDAIV